MLELYDYLKSGNGYKVRLLLAHLGIPYRYHDLDIERGDTHTPEFLAMNPAGRIPVLRLEDGTYLAESGAMLWHLSRGTRFRPEGAHHEAELLRWMFFEQNNHEPTIASLRRWQSNGSIEAKAHLVDDRKAGAYAALALMNQHLESRRFFVADTFTIADIALFAYTHVAEEGPIRLAEYPAVRAFCRRIQQMPGHVPITVLPPRL